jgi:hypothetical protein
VDLDASEKRAALCIGVAQHRDPKFPALPAAVESTRVVARAFSKTLFGPATVVADPKTPIDVFDAITKAARTARDGTLFLYFAGFVTDRNGDLLLVVGDADATQRTGCVPWSDVEAVLKRANIKRTMVILNAERIGDAPIGAVKLPTVIVSGAIRPFSKACGDAELAAYAEALTSALNAKATTIVGLLDDGVLESKGLDRAIARDTTVGHARLRNVDIPIAIRDCRAELPKPEPVVEPPPPVEEPPPPVEEPPPPPLEEPPPPVEEAPPPVDEAKPEPEPEVKAEPIVVAEPAPLATQPEKRSPLLPILLVLVLAAMFYWFFKR